MERESVTIKERVLNEVEKAGPTGVTTLEVVKKLGALTQSVYPCITQLCHGGKILDSQTRRRSVKGRRTIVWVSSEYPGVVPVWNNSKVTYGYSGRAKVIMDLIFDHGPLSSSEVCTAAKTFDQMSVSSLMSRLREQEWLCPLPDKRPNVNNRMCIVYGLTPRGVQVRDNSHSREVRHCSEVPLVRRDNDNG